MTSWGVEGGEVPRWLFALQSWDFPLPSALFSPHLWPPSTWWGDRGPGQRPKRVYGQVACSFSGL